MNQAVVRLQKASARCTIPSREHIRRGSVHGLGHRQGRQLLKQSDHILMRAYRIAGNRRRVSHLDGESIWRHGAKQVLVGPIIADGKREVRGTFADEMLSGNTL